MSSMCLYTAIGNNLSILGLRSVDGGFATFTAAFHQLNTYCIHYAMVTNKLTSRKHFKAMPMSLRISISKHNLSVLKVSLLIELVNFSVSIPLSSFLDAPVSDIYVLHKRLQSINKIPSGKCELL